MSEGKKTRRRMEESGGWEQIEGREWSKHARGARRLLGGFDSRITKGVVQRLSCNIYSCNKRRCIVTYNVMG